MAVSYERARWGVDPSGVSLVGISTSAGAGSTVVLDTVVDDDFIHRFQACAAASDAIWHYGWLACRTDGERGAWIEHYADYLESQLDA
jgi:hypothetical protein